MLKRYLKILALVSFTVVAMASFTSCDDSTATLGVDMIPSQDRVTQSYATYPVMTQSYAVGDSVLARSSRSYLGRYTDPETGTIVKSDFVTQFRCSDSFIFADSIVGDTATSVNLDIFVENYVGDSLTSMKLSIYELNKVLNANAEYYTNFDPTKYYDTTSKPVASKWFTLSNHTTSDSITSATGYYNHIQVSLPKYVYGDSIIKLYRSHPEYFATPSAYINSPVPGSKGFYIKLEQGDGAMVYIDVCQYNINYRYRDITLKKDTTGTRQFASTEEVVQATQFINSNLEDLMRDETATYIKCPAGIFTLVTIPVEEMYNDPLHSNASHIDSVNCAKLTFTRYNDVTESNFKLKIPNKLLFLPLDDYKNGFFEKYSLADHKTSYIATFNPSNNTYTFNNVAPLITALMAKKIDAEKNGKALSPYWNQMLLIPVDTDEDSSNNVVKINHDFSMSSCRLVGGKHGDAVTMEVTYSSFNAQ